MLLVVCHMWVNGLHVVYKKSAYVYESNCIVVYAVNSGPIFVLGICLLICAHIVDYYECRIRHCVKPCAPGDKNPDNLDDYTIDLCVVDGRRQLHFMYVVS